MYEFIEEHIATEVLCIVKNVESDAEAFDSLSLQAYMFLETVLVKQVKLSC